MTIDKRINFRGGGMDMGNTRSQARSASMGNTTSKSTSSGTGGSSGNIGGGGGGQDSDYRRYKAPTRPTYDSTNIDQKPITGADFQRSQNEFINNLNINNASRFTPTLFNRTYKPVTLDTVGSRNQLPGFNNGLAAILGFATGIPFNLLASGKRGMKNVNNFMGNLREDLTGYRTQQEYDDARQNRINLKRIDTIQNTLDRKYPDGNYSNTDLDERLADLKQSMGILDVTTVNEIDDRPTQTFSFDSTGFNNRNQPTGIEQVYNQVASSDVAPEFRDMIIQASGTIGNYAQNAVSNQLYGKDYAVLDPFEQQQIDTAIETYGTKSTGELASGTDI